MLLVQLEEPSFISVYSGPNCGQISFLNHCMFSFPCFSVKSITKIDKENICIFHNSHICLVLSKHRTFHKAEAYTLQKVKPVKWQWLSSGKLGLGVTPTWVCTWLCYFFQLCKQVILSLKNSFTYQENGKDNRVIVYNI